jgi:hypothetical protein
MLRKRLLLLPSVRGVENCVYWPWDQLFFQHNFDCHLLLPFEFDYVLHDTGGMEDSLHGRLGEIISDPFHSHHPILERRWKRHNGIIQAVQELNESFIVASDANIC